MKESFMKGIHRDHSNNKQTLQILAVCQSLLILDKFFF